MDSSTKIKNGIQLYFHCKDCISKGKKDRVAVGWTIKGLQVWCDACNTNILALDFEGRKIQTDDLPDMPHLNKN